MATTVSADRQTQILWLSLAIVGAIVSLIGWYQWLT
jgi:hypothetical protein